MSKIDLEDGKYTVVYEQGRLTALRNGEPWRDMVGDQLVGAMFFEIERLRDLSWASKHEPMLPAGAVLHAQLQLNYLGQCATAESVGDPRATIQQLVEVCSK